MDYLDHVTVVRHASWEAFQAWRGADGAPPSTLTLATTRAATSYLEHRFSADEILLFGRESAGVPEHVHAAADARLCIPMREGLRSLNVAMACAMMVGEMARQDVANNRSAR